MKTKLIYVFVSCLRFNFDVNYAHENEWTQKMKLTA